MVREISFRSASSAIGQPTFPLRTHSPLVRYSTWVIEKQELIPRSRDRVRGLLPRYSITLPATLDMRAIVC